MTHVPFSPFTARFSFKIDEDGINCFVEAVATASEVFEAACAMIMTSVHTMEFTEKYGKNTEDFSSRLLAMRAARDALQKHRETRIVSRDARVVDFDA